MERTKDIVSQEFECFKRRQRTDGENLKNEILNDFTAIIQKLKDGFEELKSVYTDEMEVICENDIVESLVNKIYENSRTSDFTIMEKAYICEEGEMRYKYKIAPGYTDETKKNSDNDKSDFYRKYGDLIIWKEILKKVENTNINKLFIENEKKKDQFSEKGGNKLAPVLYEEYEQATHGNGKIEVCDFLAFLERYEEPMELLDTKINELIEKLKFEKAVLNYVDEHDHDILVKLIDKHFEDISNIFEIFYDSQHSVFGGTFEDVEDLSLNYVNITSGVMRVYDRTRNNFYLKTSYGVSGSVFLTEYINRV